MKLSTEEKKAIAARYYNGETVAALIAKTGIPRSTLYHWIKLYKPLKSVTSHPATEKEFQDLQRSYIKQSKILELIQKSGYFPAMPLEEKLALYREFEHEYSTHVLCEALHISRGTYHKRIVLGDTPTVYQKRREEIAPLIQAIFEESDRRLGSIKIHAILKSRGIDTSKKYVLKLMQEMGLESISVNAKKTHKHLSPKKNIVNRHFNPAKPNQVWVGDITSFVVKNKRLYICAILDLYSRKIIAYKISQRQTTQLVTSTFKLAFSERKYPQNLIFHSDRGSQYTSKAFLSLLSTSGVTPSFSEPGQPHDNAVIESFFSQLKKEELYRRNYKSEREFRESVATYISFYNNDRPHRYNNYKTPTQKECDC